MSHDDEEIRGIVAEMDKQIAALEVLDEQYDEMDLLIAIMRLKEARFWLKELGHASHFDTPQGGETE